MGQLIHGPVQGPKGPIQTQGHRSRHRRAPCQQRRGQPPLLPHHLGHIPVIHQAHLLRPRQRPVDAQHIARPFPLHDSHPALDPGPHRRPRQQHPVFRDAQVHAQPVIIGHQSLGQGHMGRQVLLLAFL